MKGKRNQGFTLVELVIVVAIMVVLVAVLASQYIRYVEKARAQVCVTSRSEMTREAFMDYIDAGGSESFKDMLLAMVEAHADERLCKDGGVYSVKEDADGEPYIHCSEHPTNVPAFGNDDIMEKIKVALNNTTSNYIDSNASSVSNKCDTYKVEQALKEQGIDLKAMGAATWRYNKSKGILSWSMTDINGLEKDDVLPILRYNMNTGTYTVWYSKVTTSTTSTNSGGVASDPYKVLADETGPYTPSTVGDKVQSYETALELYKQAVEEMEKING